MSKVQIIPITDIKVGERFRQDYGGPEFHVLMDSIKQKGLLQPITLDQDLNLLAGGRRFLACRNIGLKEIPALIRTTEGELDAREVELYENAHRKALTWQEKAKLVKAIHDLHVQKHGEWTQSKTAVMLDKSIGGVSMDIKMADYLTAIPELNDCKTADDARRMIAQLEEKIVVQQMVEQLREEIEAGEEEGYDEPTDEPETTSVARYADSHYRVGDAIAGLGELCEAYKEQESPFNIIEVDPPYAIDLDSIKKTYTQAQQDSRQQYEELQGHIYQDYLENLYTLCYNTAGVHAWLIAWFGQTWFCETKSALQKSGWIVDDIPLIWTKPNGQTQQPELYLARAYEMAFICRKGQPLINKRGHINVFAHDPVPPSKKYHPTQRPISLMRDLLETFAFPRSIVCVPFLGSGVTLKAAYQLGMTGVGWDLSQENKDRFLITLDGDG